MSAAAGPKEERADTNGGVRKSGKTSKPYDSYLLRYQELKHMKEGRNPPRNQQNLRRNEQDTQDDSNGEMPQINEELDDEKGSKGRQCKTKLCALL